jgi:hypothetical protein
VALRAYFGSTVTWLALVFAISAWVIVMKYVIQPLQSVQKIVDAKAKQSEATESVGLPVHEDW